MQAPFDVIVVGSGPGGGIAAYALASHGLKVALLEAGRRLIVGKDYGRDLPPLDLLERRLADKRFGAFDSAWDFRERNHFTPVGDRPDHGLIKALGGRSLCWAGHSLRFGPLDFKQWPISYDQVAPYYSRAEKFMAVYGYKDGLSNMPDGEFIQPVPMRRGEAVLKRGVNALKSKGRTMDFVALRKAMATEKHASGRAVCQYCGNCGGCPIDSKYTSANTPIPAGIKTGNLKVITNATLQRILMAKGSNKVEAVEYVDAEGKVTGLRCRSLVLACSAVETARILLYNNVANSSGQVGKHLNTHFGLTVKAVFPELANKDTSDDAGTGYYHSLLTNMYWDKPNPNFEGTYQVQCGSGFLPQRLYGAMPKGFGKGFKEELRVMNAAHVGMNMQGSMLISDKKYIDLDPDKKDKFGMPLPRVHLKYEASDIAMAEDCMRVCHEIIDAAKGKVASTPGNNGKLTADDLVVDNNHWVGSTRMGRDPKKSVVNEYSQSHDVPNLFVGDASVFATYPEKNPTLSNIALSWRMSDYLAEQAKKGNL
jgi:choline dehydrogenase-like flavoprotein